jgi:hypothetical protein
VEDDSAHGLDDVGTDLDQAFSERLDLGASAGSSRGAQSQLLHEDVGGSGEKYPELIGPEARAACAVDFEAELELFDAVLRVPALAVDMFVDPLRRLGEVGDNEAGVLPLGSRPGCRTTSALTMTRRFFPQLLAA